MHRQQGGHEKGAYKRCLKVVHNRELDLILSIILFGELIEIVVYVFRQRDTRSNSETVRVFHRNVPEHSVLQHLSLAMRTFSRYSCFDSFAC